MIYEYLLIIVFIAYLRGGSLRNVSDTEFAFPLLFFLALMLQFSIIYIPGIPNILFSGTIIFSYVLLLYAVWRNRSLPGFSIFLIGLFLNAFVIIMNGGRMPVSSQALETIGMKSAIPLLQDGHSKHALLTQETNFPFLADVIAANHPFVWMTVVVSIGDVLMTVALAWFLYRSMTKKPAGVSPLSSLHGQ